MSEQAVSLWKVFEGWEGFNTSLIRAIEQSTPEALAHQPGAEMRSAAEVFRHISLGRVNWFRRIDAPGSDELARQVPAWHTDAEGNRYANEESVSLDPSELKRWMNSSWRMIEKGLKQWTVSDLFHTFPHTYLGKRYTVSYQWVLWRILSHDIYHGGQLTILLGSQGIDLPELAWLGGHLTEPPRAD